MTQNQNHRGQREHPLRAPGPRGRSKRRAYPKTRARMQQTSSLHRRPKIEPLDHEMDMEIGALNQPGVTPIFPNQPARFHAPRPEHNMQTTENASPLFAPRTPTSAFNSHIEQLSHEFADCRRNFPSVDSAIENLTQVVHKIEDNAKGAVRLGGNDTAHSAFGDCKEHGDDRSWVDTAVTVITQGYEDEVNHQEMIRSVKTSIDAMQITHRALLAKSPYESATRIAQAMIEQNANDHGGKAFVESELDETSRRLQNN